LRVNRKTAVVVYAAVVCALDGRAVVEAAGNNGRIEAVTFWVWLGSSILTGIVVPVSPVLLVPVLAGTAFIVLLMTGLFDEFLATSTTSEPGVAAFSAIVAFTVGELLFLAIGISLRWLVPWVLRAVRGRDASR
jgi:hypothetical protein